MLRPRPLQSLLLGLALAVPAALAGTAEPPAIATCAPDLGPVGTLVVLTGAHLAGATRVAVNGRLAWYRVLADDRLECRIPPDARPGPITVATPTGKASSGKFLVAP